MARKEVRRLIKKYSVGLANQGLIQKVWNQLLKINNRYAFNLNKANFEGTMENSKIIFTCGGCLNYPIRKFLEAPARGSLLMFYPFKGYEDFGFIHGKNCIVIEDISELNSKIVHYVTHGDLLDEIAKAGQKLIWEKHTLTRRADQISQCLELITKNSFYGSEWRAGDFKIHFN